MKKPKKKPCNCKKKEEDYPLYIQSSNPTPKLLKFIEEQLKVRVVYFQSGTPPPPCGGPFQPKCTGG